MEFAYDVFFSYRHRPLDGEITQKTFNAIESYRLPQSIRDQGCQDIRRAFRDTEELPVSRILTDTIDRALHSTNCLVVVCSTDTPSSEWIDREVQTFIEIGRAEHIYPLLISGDPEHSFPPSLKLVPDIMDRVMDIRTPGNHVKKMMAKEETELLRVIAGIVGCKESELLREHKLRKSRRFAARALGWAAAFALVAGVSLYLMNLAQDYRDEARLREQGSMRILSELTYALPDHLTNIPGAYGRIADILEKNTRDINAIVALSTEKERAAFEAGTNYEKLATASTVLGEMDRALEAEDEAIVIFQGLEEQEAPKAGAALASAANNRGNILNAAGRYDEAALAYEDAIARLRTLPDDNSLTLARTLYNAGSNAVDQGETERAEARFEESLQLFRDVPESEETLEWTAWAEYNYGVLLYQTGRYAQAEEHLMRAHEKQEALLQKANSMINQKGDVLIVSALAALLTDEGRFDDADICYERAIEAAEGLAKAGDNVENTRLLAELYNNRALAYNIRGAYAEADTLYEKAGELARATSEKTGSAADRALYALYLLNRGENAFKLGDQSRSRSCFEAGLAEYEAALPQLGDYDRSQRFAWLSYYELIHRRDFDAALEAALAGRELQPDNVLVNLNLAYACLYGGYREDAENLLQQIAALGGGQKETIRVDLEAQQRAGMPLDRAEELYALLGLE